VPIVKESKAEATPSTTFPAPCCPASASARWVYGFTEAAKSGWSSTSALLSFSIAACSWSLPGAGVAGRQPLLPLRVVWHRNRAGSFLTSIILGAGMMGMFLFMTYFFQQIQHYFAAQEAVSHTCRSGALIVTAGVASGLLPRVGPRVIIP